MAIFTTIPNTDLDANSPLTEPLMLALRDNPIAIAQGDITAPNIASEAFADNTISLSKLKSSGLSSGAYTYVNPSQPASTVYYFYIPLTGMASINMEEAGINLQMEIFTNGAWNTIKDRFSTSISYRVNMFMISTGSNIRVRILAYVGGGTPTMTVNYSKII